MILGFISLLLTFGQSYIVKICIPQKLADNMLPCPYKYKDAEKASDNGDKHRRKLLSYERRYLAADTTSFKCSNEVFYNYLPLFFFIYSLFVFEN